VATDHSFPIVGIGASAGGVEALEGFFRGMPSDTGMAFVLVTHMPRGHVTMLSEILGRCTDMPVTNVRHGEAVDPNHVYVCPSDHVVTIEDGRLMLEARSAEVQRKPIDVFLSSLAEHRGENAVGVVLSGGGSDGALGIKAIKERGGLTLAQGSDGSAPRQTSMPEAAIATGFVDLTLPVEDMASRLTQFARSYRDIEPPIAAEAERESDDLVEARRSIARLLHDQVGHDFSGYKERTFMRRVRRRMQIVQVDDLAGYVERLRKEPEEVTLLFRDLLIGVTNFFRDKSAFEALEQLVIPKLFEGAGAAGTVRIWVPGCATGEEVYSIAILLREHLDKLRNVPRVQIFASDIDEAALAVARAGRYPQALMEGVEPERLDRFFSRDDAGYTVVKEIRDMCVFSAHSVIRDPPFSRIDLISCRNLLIYLGPEFQSRVIPVFHFALKPGGYLFLGTSENISQYGDLFHRVDRKQRLFQRRDHVATPLQFPLFVPGARTVIGGVVPQREPGTPTANLRRVVESRVLETFAPPHVVVNREGDIIHYSSRTGKYLEAAAGMPSRQLLALARRGLRLDLRSALQEAIETRRTTVREDVAVEIDDGYQHITLTVEPLGDHDADPLFLVLFADVGRPQRRTEAAAVDRPARDVTAEQFRRELHDTRERLQATVEEYETALEELKAANEEMVSVNEELQSTNEELETSKEELQSVNEELHTVNAELNSKIEELDRANADLRNLFESTQIATIFLDGELVIRSFTPAATSIFNLISTDRGRPLTDIMNQLENGDLRREVRIVLERGETIERQVRRSDGKTHYLMRVLPYRTRPNVVDGVLVTFFDITRMVEAEARQRTLVEELDHRVRNMLTVVAAITKQTLAKSASPDDFAAALQGRVQALAKSYGLLSRQQWGTVSLRDILLNELEPYRQESEARLALDGPPVALKPAAALALGLVVHELATNATKYGALSNSDGRVSVGWRIDRGERHSLALTWRESNGAVVKKPKRKGFGTELIEREVSGALGGKAAFDYAADGLKVRISIPLDSANVSPQPAAGPSSMADRR
jgi:two-component system, chemotaxis family, CheB/CheR fusion protein